MQTPPALRPVERPADTELIAPILAGDMRAMEALMRLHNRTLYRTARAILRDDAEAEDAVQEAYLQAFRALGTFRGESKLSTWLVRITANAALMRRRRNAGAATAAPIDVDPDDLVSDDAGPESGAQRSDMRRLLQERIGALPEGYRAVFMLRAIEELTVEETAAALGIPEATVRTRYFRARSLLRKSMAGDVDKRSSLDSPLLITDKDRARLTLLKPHAALLREIERAVVISPKAATLVDAVTMNTQVRYTDETTGAQQLVNIVYPQEAGGCACCVSVLAPVGTALLGLSAGQAIEWDFPDGAHRRLRVDQVIHHDCPLNSAARHGSSRPTTRRRWDPHGTAASTVRATVPIWWCLRTSSLMATGSSSARMARGHDGEPKEKSPGSPVRESPRR